MNIFPSVDVQLQQMYFIISFQVSFPSFYIFMYFDDFWWNCKSQVCLVSLSHFLNLV